MVEGLRRTNMPRRLNTRASAVMTGAGAVLAGHRQGLRRHLVFGQPGSHRTGYRNGTSRYMLESMRQRIPGKKRAGLNRPYIATADTKDALDSEPTGLLCQHC